MRILFTFACLIYGNITYTQEILYSFDSCKNDFGANSSSFEYNFSGCQNKNSQSSSGKTRLDLRSFTDSLKLKNSVKTSTDNSNDYGNRIFNFPRLTYDWLKNELPKGNDLLKFSMNMRSENFGTTSQNPMIRSELMYSRLYLSPTFTVLGLPFTSNLFFTTEANNTYKNNFFSFRLDVNALRRIAQERLRKEVEQAKKLDRSRQLELNKQALETKKYQQELDKVESEMNEYKQWNSQIQNQAQLKSKAYLDKERAQLEEQLKTASDEQKEQMIAAYNQKSDSVQNALRSQLEDSAAKLKGTMPNLDTSKLNRINRLKTKMEQLNQRAKEIESLRQKDTLGLSEKAEGLRHPEKLKSMTQGQLPGKGLMNRFLSVDRLGVGLIAPMYSEFTLSAASVKGLDIGVSKTNWYYDISLGRMTKQFTGPFSSVQPEYDRNMAIARIGLGERNNAHLAVEYFSAFDTKVTDSMSPMVNNGVLALEFKYVFLKHLTVDGDLAQSNYKEKFNSLNISSSSNSSNSIFNIRDSRAYRLKATQEAGKNTKLQVEARQVGAAFRSLGNPFLRRNFREIDARLEQSFYKKQILLQANYKEMRDNVLELNQATNRLKGWGIKLQTAFEKWPNLTLSHSPYQQGNNHPDSLYRTNNQFSISMAMLTYKKRFKGLNWNMMACATRSAMEIYGRGPVDYRMLTITNMVQLGLRHNIMLNYMSNTTLPGVDSLNSNSIQFNYIYLAKKGFTIGTIGEHTIYKNQAFRSGGGLTASANLIKNLSLSALVRYDKIDGLWRLENQDVWTGRLVLLWSW